MAKSKELSEPPRLKMFSDPAAEVVWAGLMTLDVALQHQVLRELACAVAVEPNAKSRSADDRVRAAVGALHEAFELLGRSPSVRDYTELRKRLPDLGLPPESNIRKWLALPWNGCLHRALLPAPSDGDFTYEDLDHDFTLEELIEFVLACASDLDKRPSVHDFRAWVRRPDVAERFPRRPTSDHPFRRFKGWLPVVDKARAAAAERGLDSPLLKTTPRVYEFSKLECIAALQEVTGRLVARIGDRAPRMAEYHGERLLVQEESIENRAPRALPSPGYISKLFGGWDEGLIAAGFEPLGGSGTKSNYPKHRRPPTRTAPFTRDDKANALKEAWVELGNPFSVERYDEWREGRITEAELRGEEIKIPTSGIIAREFRGWRRACRAQLAGYVDPRRRWKKRPADLEAEDGA